MEDHRDFADTVHGVKRAAAMIIIQDRFGLGFIFHKAMLDGVDVIISTSADLATFQHTFNKEVLRHIKTQHTSEGYAIFLHHLVKNLSLPHGTRIAVEEKTRRSEILGEFFLDDGSDNLVGDKTTLADDALYLKAEFGLGGDLLTQNLTG